MIHLDGGDGPTYRHENIESARAEAQRLTTETHRKAFILRAVESAEFTNVVWSKVESGEKHTEDCNCHDCIPF